MRRRSRTTRASLALLAGIAVLVAALPAEAMVNARSMGMAGVYGIAPHDADAMLWNPALLGLAGPRDHFSMTVLPNLSLGLGNNVLSFTELAGLIANRKFESAEVQQVLETLPPTGWRVLFDSGTSLAVSMPSSRTGVFMEAIADTKGLDVPRDLFALVLNGNASVPNVRIDSLQGATATGAASLGTSFAFPVGAVASLGMNLRYMRGLAYARVSEARGSLLSVDASGKYSADAYVETEVATSGNGIAADLGAAGLLGGRLHWGAVLGNLGVMNWSQVDVTAYTLKVEPFSIVDASGSVTDFGAVTRDAMTESKRQEGPREMVLPPYARLYGAFHPWQPLAVTGVFQVGFGEGFGVSQTPELKLGSELRLIDWLPLRGGIAVGGERGLFFTTGLGLDMPHFRLDFAMGAINGVAGHARGASYTLSNTLRF
jgi:hypothetical protein